MMAEESDVVAVLNNNNNKNKMGKYRTFILISITVFIILALILTGILLAVKTIQTSDHDIVSILQDVNNRPLNFRLPKNLVPELYEIHVFTDFDSTLRPNGFNGTCRIHFKCLNETSRLFLHSTKIIVDEASIVIFDVTNGVQLRHSSTSYDIDRQFYIVDLMEKFVANKSYTVFMRYAGLLLDDTAGLYRSAYLDAEMNRRWIVASQMQPTDARKAFPCFDEPWMKAKFKITIDHHKSLSALSNMPVLTTKTTSYNLNLTETSFEESVKMSTYLVAIVISDFKCKYATAKAGVTGSVNVSVCGYNHVSNQFDFALKNLVELLEKYEKRFQIKYPLTKCDNVGLPDFLYLGMENFGLITYRETHLFTPDRNSTILTTPERLILDVLVHEIVHIWFGNIVTPEWWDDLWLSEGFATFLQLENYGMMLLNSLFGIDSLSNSYSIYMEITKLTDTEQIFNEMTYVKASIVVRLLKSLLGEELFDRFVLNYLNRFQYSYVNQFDLYNIIQEEIEKKNDTDMPPMDDFIQSWTRQNGHPIVHVNILNSSTIMLTQERYLVDPSVVEHKPKHKWYISFTYDTIKYSANETSLQKNSSKNRKTNITWITPNEEQSLFESLLLEIKYTIDLFIEIVYLPKKLENDDIIIGNLELSGFYRVNYDLDNWDKILNQLKINASVIPYENRVQIINDIFSFGRNGILEATKPFELLDYLENDSDVYLWRTAINHLREIFNMLQSSDTLKKYQNYMFKIIKNAQEKAFSKNKESEIISAIFPFACEIGFKDCIDLSKKTFAISLKGNNDSNTSLIEQPEFIICTGIKYGTKKEWDFVLNLHDKTTDSLTRKMLQHTLACTRDFNLLDIYLNNQLNETRTKRYDTLHAISTASKSQYSNGFVWNFVKQKWSYIYEKFGSKNIIEFNHFLSTITDGFHTEDQLLDFIQFFNENPDHETISRQVRQSIEKIKSVIKWRECNLNNLSEWFKNKTITKM